MNNNFNRILVITFVASFAILTHLYVTAYGQIQALYENETSDYFNDRGYNVTNYQLLPNGTLVLHADPTTTTTTRSNNITNTNTTTTSPTAAAPPTPPPAAPAIQTQQQQDPEFTAFVEKAGQCANSAAFGSSGATMSQEQCTLFLEQGVEKWCGLASYDAEKCSQISKINAAWKNLVNLSERYGFSDVPSLGELGIDPRTIAPSPPS